MNKKMIFITILFVFILFTTIGCDTELGHRHDEIEHDHDNDGIPDHTSEEHQDDHNENIEQETNFSIINHREK